MTRVLAKHLGEQKDPTLSICYQPGRRIVTSLAKDAFAQYRAEQGFKRVATTLLSAPDTNMKLNKSVVPSYGLALAQANLSGWNLCPGSTKECRKHCVAFAGNGSYPAVTRARIAKTRFLAAEPQLFLSLLTIEIDRAVRKHGTINLRLNTFSDLPWETIAPWLFTRWGSAVQFYDYTKLWDRVPPANYNLVLSASEKTSYGQIADAVEAGRAVAVVVDFRRSEPITDEFHVRGDWRPLPMIDGDKSDDRTENRGVVVALRPKGTMRKSSMVFHAV